MRSKPVAALLVELDITKSHSRPYVSDDNPYSEAQFKTLKCTGRISRNASAASRMHDSTVEPSSPGTTRRIGTRASAT